MRSTPQPRDNAWAREHGLVDRFVVMHSGNIGHAQNLDVAGRALRPARRPRAAARRPDRHRRAPGPHSFELARQLGADRSSSCPTSRVSASRCRSRPPTFTSSGSPRVSPVSSSRAASTASSPWVAPCSQRSTATARRARSCRRSAAAWSSRRPARSRCRSHPVACSRRPRPRGDGSQRPGVRRIARKPRQRRRPIPAVAARRPQSTSVRKRGRELAAPALLVVIVAAQVLLQSRLLHNGTNFDEGVYLAAVDALRHGQQLGTDVFAAQFPGFYDLLRVAAVVAGASIAGVRAVLIGVFCLGTVGAWLIGRRFGGTPGAALTAGLFVVAPPLDLFGSQVIADTPALALTVLAVGLATIGGPVAAVGAGIAFALGLSVKLTAVTAVPALVWYLRRRTLLAVSAAAGRRVRAACAARRATGKPLGERRSLPRGRAFHAGGHPASAPPDPRPDPAPDAVLLARGRGDPAVRHRDRAASPTGLVAALALERADGRLPACSTRRCTTTT